MDNQQRTTFGRTCGGRTPWPGAIAVGVAAAGVIATLTLFFNGGQRGMWLAAVMTAVSLPLFTALGWVLLVDRRTIKGATERPEESVEAAWLEAASVSAFRDLILVMGLGLAVVNLVPTAHGVLASHAVTGLLVFAAVDVAVRYVVVKRRDA